MARSARARLCVSGKVQGVFYRADCTVVAKGLGVQGWVRNLDDGRVELVVEGDRDKIEKMIEWCHEGPDMAEVENVEVSWEKPEGEGFFRITY